MRSHGMGIVAAALAAGLLGAPPRVAGQGTDLGTVSGTVLLESAGPAQGVRVEIVDLRRRTATDERGAYRFTDVPPGEYLVQALSERFGQGLARAVVPPGGSVTVDLTLDLDGHHETVVVTAQPEARSLAELAQPVTVLAGTDLALELRPTLGETLARQPGVSSTFFGPGASRPVIRGLGGDRIRVLHDGLGTADASSTSPDHAVSFDLFAARQVEVVRGPATLLYGSNAVGGVVNVIDERIPTRAAERALGGALDVAGATAADERGAALSLGGGTGRFAWHGDYLRRRTDDFSIPGFAESAALRAEEAAEGEEHDQALGTVENSTTDSEGGALGASLVGESGFLGVAVSGLDSLYGVPGGHGHGHSEEELGGGDEPEGEDEEAVRIDLRQRRADLRGEITRPFGAFRAARLRLGLADYEQRELEGETVGTRFTNDAWEGRLEVLHKPAGPFSGSLGVQAARRDFEAVGEEAFFPPSLTRTWAVFAFEEARRGDWRFQLGGRLERQEVEAEGEMPRARSFTGASGSAGFVWQRGEDYSVGLTVARSTKLPNAEELFSNGPHIATRAFEIGDPTSARRRAWASTSRCGSGRGVSPAS